MSHLKGSWFVQSQKSDQKGYLSGSCSDCKFRLLNLDYGCSKYKSEINIEPELGTEFCNFNNFHDIVDEDFSEYTKANIIIKLFWSMCYNTEIYTEFELVNSWVPL
jgi:hypothetical protein